MPGNFYTPTVEDILKWPKANYTNPPEQQHWLVPFVIVWQVISTILVAGRIHLRATKRSGPFGIDDILILLAWISSLALVVSACRAEWTFHLGRHIWNYPPQDFAGSLLNGWLAQIFFLLASTFTKCSILLFYRRMAKNTYSDTWLRTIWVLMFVTIGSGVGIFLAYCFMCEPLNFYWDFLYLDSKNEPASCINGDAVTIATGTITIASDFWTAALPCIMFQKFDVGATRRQKILLNCLFCVGFLVTGVGVARTYYLWKMGHDEDLSWWGYKLFAVSVVETQLALIVVNVPFLRAFFRRYFPSFTTQTSQTGRSRTTAAAQYSGTEWNANPRSSFVTAYTTDENGKVYPLSDCSTAKSPTEGEMFSTVEAEEMEWARRQVQQSNYMPRASDSPAGSFEVDEAEQKEARERMRRHEATLSTTAAQEQEKARAQVQAWVTKRPARDGDEDPILPNMSPTAASNPSWPRPSVND
ncbi:hypothetical protein DOTSEDRAFT_71349 [Dothistroma septosporum NZE10]|uniref:Rhodopsin domain-containing protein n=1 Tax=Dothistroma septosporum (strain NZE10 / CBS 128990) TaxID=675120 RepID=N1PQB5_DOTSN|nr:hypothetical protein DOTSEDRAFT_71349 [Dothistroma septosporum NZE10]